MPAVASSAAGLTPIPGGGWRCGQWGSARVAAAITDAHIDAAALIQAMRGAVATVSAEQVHGGSVAVIRRAVREGTLVPGCDALITDVPGMALCIRTADCLPIFFADPARQVVGLAHAGWRGLAAFLPARVVAAFSRMYRSRADELRVAIGPAIRSCCYEVGPEFSERFGPFVEQRGARRTCDLIGVAMDQLRRCGIRPQRIVDAGRCTACESERWFSLRREGPATGRLTSIIMVRA